MEEEVDIVLTTRLEREFSDHGAKRVELVVVEVVAGPDAEDVGVTSNLAVSVLVFETGLVLVVTLLHSLAPVDIGIVNCAHLVEQFIRSNIFRVKARTKTTGSSIVTISVGTKSAESVIADIISDSQLLVGAKEWSSHVSGKTRVDVNIRNLNFVLIVHVTSLDLSMLLCVFIRGVIGVGIQLDGLESGLFGEVAGFILVDEAFGDGLVVAVFRDPLFGRSQGTDTIVETSQPVQCIVSARTHVVTSDRLTECILPRDNPQVSFPGLGSQALGDGGICDGDFREASTARKVMSSPRGGCAAETI